MTLTKDDFPIGTRVRVVKFPTPSQIGTTGTVQPHDTEQDPTKQYVFVQRDGRTASDQFPFRPSELEIIEPETTFAPGDVVRVKDDITLDNGKHNGQVGTVIRIGVYYVWAKVPTSSGPVPFNDSELTHVEPATPDLAASIRERVDSLTNDLLEVETEIAALSANRDTLRQDIAALKNAAARLEAQK